MSDAETLKRAFLPEILLPADIAVALKISEEEALKMMAVGDLGKTFRVGQTIGLLRSAFLAALKRAGSAR